MLHKIIKTMQNIESDIQLGGRKKQSVASKVSASKTVKPKSSKKPKKGGSEGGALLDDVKNLAVPFAILLAKQGLQHMFDKSKDEKKEEEKKERKQSATTKTVTVSASAKKSPRSAKKSVSGGSCGSQCAANLSVTGGSASALKSRFEKLSKEIDDFLQQNN